MRVTDIQTLLAYMDRRFDAIEAQLATKANIADIKDMATRADMADMATKADIADMVRKTDIIDMATKADIADMATKDDLEDMAAALRLTMVSKADLAGLATKKDFDLLYNMLDGFIKRLDEDDQERAYTSHRIKYYQHWIDQAPTSAAIAAGQVY